MKENSAKRDPNAGEEDDLYQSDAFEELNGTEVPVGLRASDAQATKDDKEDREDEEDEEYSEFEEEGEDLSLIHI